MLPDDTPLKALLLTALPTASSQLLQLLRVPSRPSRSQQRQQQQQHEENEKREEDEPQTKKIKKQPSVATPIPVHLFDATLQSAVSEYLLNTTTQNEPQKKSKKKARTNKKTSQPTATATATAFPTSLLLARFPPPDGLLDAFIATHDTDSDKDSHNDETILTLCNGLASQATTVEQGLALFAPALSKMLATVQAIDDNDNDSDSDGMHVNASTAQWHRLAALSSRCIMCMHLIIKEKQIQAKHGSGTGTGGDEECGGRWWLQWGDGSRQRRKKHKTTSSSSSGNTSPLMAARSACSAAVSLRTAARMREAANAAATATTPAALTAYALCDMQLLSPYAAQGQVIASADVVVEEVAKAREEVKLFLALNAAAAAAATADPDHHHPDPDFYFLRMLAARNTSAMAESVGDEGTAARVLAVAAAATPPPSALEWLRQQPPSRLVVQALEALQRRGPQGLSEYLVYEVPEKGVRALGVAAKAGGVLKIGGSVDGNEDGDGGLSNRGATDDLLFYVSTEGDDVAAAAAVVSDEEGDAGGLNLDELPDEGKEMSTSSSYEEEEDYDV